MRNDSNLKAKVELQVLQAEAAKIRAEMQRDREYQKRIQAETRLQEEETRRRAAEEKYRAVYKENLRLSQASLQPAAAVHPAGRGERKPTCAGPSAFFKLDQMIENHFDPFSKCP